MQFSEVGPWYIVQTGLLIIIAYRSGSADHHDFCRVGHDDCSHYLMIQILLGLSFSPWCPFILPLLSLNSPQTFFIETSRSQPSVPTNKCIKASHPKAHSTRNLLKCCTWEMSLSSIDYEIKAYRLTGKVP